jgi:hypothetical protein
MKLTTFIPLAFLLISCASSPSTVPTSTAPAASSAGTAKPVPPDWTSKSVYVENGNLVFVITGAELADQNALALSAMSAYLNLPTSSTTSVAAIKEIKKFLARESAILASDKFLQDGKGWWKIAVPKADWDDNRGKLKAMLEAAPDSTDPERLADDLLRQGKYADAVSAYLTAAASAVAAGHAPNPGKFKSAFGKAQDVVSKLTLTSPTAALTTNIGQAFDQTFDVRVSFGTQAGAPMAPGVPVKFTFPAKTDGTLGTTSVSMVSDTQGFAKFAMPAPSFTVRDSVTVTIDVTAWEQMLAAAPQDFQTQAAALDNPDHKLLLPYAVESAAKQTPLIVALADSDDKGGLRHQESTSALIAALQKLGYQASGIQVNLSLLKSPRDNVIVTAWKFQGKTTGRAVYGTVSLVSATTAAPFTAEVAGSVKVVDLETNKLVYQLKSGKIVTATDRATAIIQAFRQWGQETAATFDSELP